MEGPYRDLGSGFARLTGVEGARRGPSRLSHVEDALLELLRNSRDAGARNIFVASTLRRRRFRALTVIDDGEGIPETHKSLIFEPGVTTRHLNPVLDPDDPEAPPHGAGLALYHVKNAAASAEVLSAASPTAIRVVFDTQTIPERALQSASRPSKTNLRATLEHFSASNPRAAPIKLHQGSPAPILAALLNNHIIQTDTGTSGVRERAADIGLELSLRTVQRVLRGEIRSAEVVSVGRIGGKGEKGARRGRGVQGPVLRLGEEERRGIAAILGRVAKNSYLEVADLEIRARPGEVWVRARVYEPEEEYE